MRFVCVVLVCGVSAVTVARADPGHDQIRAQRSVANARLAEQERECATRFIVANCIEDARNGNRLTLTRLRLQELQLDEARRRAAAEARRKVITEKAESQQARASEVEAQPPRVRMRRDGPQSAPAPEENRASEATTPTAPAANAERATNEQRSEQRYDVRARALRDHKESVERRNVQRAARGKVAAPLPVPAGGSAPR